MSATRERRRASHSSCDRGDSDELAGSPLLCAAFTLVNLTLSLLILPQIWPALVRGVGAHSRELSDGQNAFLIYADNEQSRYHEPQHWPELVHSGSWRRQAKSLPFRSSAAAAQGRQASSNTLLLDTQQKLATSGGNDNENTSGNGANSNGLLVCPEGWQQHATQCYKFFHQRHSWQYAKETCERHGAQLALIYQYRQNNFTGQLALAASAGASSIAGPSSTSQAAVQLAGGPLSQAQSDAAAYRLAGAPGFGPLGAASALGSGQLGEAAEQRAAYWIGFRAIDRLETNTLESAANTFVSKYLGFWDYEEPRVDRGECVQATLKRLSAGDRTLREPQQVWQLARCEDLLPFVCQRQVCPSNSFHCSNGRCINAAWKCDGSNDCGDDSDEMDCPRRCRFYMASSGDKVQSINYPARYEPGTDCKWTLEGPLDAGMMLQFYEFDTERHYDQVQVLAGARTEDRAFSLATLSGQLNLTQRPFVSGSNLMIVKFKSDSLVERRGFRASWKTEPIECGGELFVHNAAQLITSPFYPDYYPGALECVYRLVAPPGKLISLELIELDLAPGRDFLSVRDGSQSGDLLLASLTGQLHDNEERKHLTSTSNKLYLYFRSEHSAYEEPRRGFAIRFRAGCDIELVAANGTLASPAYQVGRYPLNQQCVYRVSRPDAASAASTKTSAITSAAGYQTTMAPGQASSPVATPALLQAGLTLKFDDFDLGPEDRLSAYDGHELASAQRIQPLRPASSLQDKAAATFAKSALLSAPSGKMTLVFSSSALPASGGNQTTQPEAQRNGPRGFRATFSADCAPLKLGRNVIVAQGQQAALTGARFGQQLSYSCPRGQEFATGQLKLHNECRLGGRWTLAKVPNCQERYCGPVPQIDNGFAINATGVTFNQTATYKCYNGFNLASGRSTETITCLESGQWGKLPECYSTSCPPIREVANARQLVLAGSGLTRSYGTVIRFECERGYQRVGVPTLLCTSAAAWSSAPPECVRAQCRQVPQVENGQLVELEQASHPGRSAPPPAPQAIPPNRKFYFMDEARVQCNRGFRLEPAASNSSLAAADQHAPLMGGVIRCGANQTFELVPRCVDVDECQLTSTCEPGSSVCRFTWKMPAEFKLLSLNWTARLVASW